MPEDPKKEKNYEIEREGTEVNLIIKWKDPTSYPSIENNPLCMDDTVNKLMETGSVTTIIFEAERNYIYPLTQAKLMNELASLFIKLVKEKKVLSIELISEKCRKVIPDYVVKVREIINTLKSDPIGAYLIALRHYRTIRSRLKITEGESERKCVTEYAAIIEDIVKDIAGLKIIRLIKDKLPGYKVGDRELYTVVFEPIIKPNFMYTRLISEPPMRAEEIDSYRVGENDVVVYELPDKIRYVYHIVPPEFKLDENDYTLLDEARQIMVKFKPRREEFVNPTRMREVFFNIGKDLVEELARNNEIKMSYKKIEKLARILMRLTVGFGLIEVLLEDEKVEDIYVNAPVGSTPIIFKHSIHGECETNIYPNIKEAKAWASRFRMLSGRALDEANPVLDTELETKKARARVAVIQKPLSPTGLAFTFRRHRERPWTLPLFMKVGMITPLSAGLISFLIDGARPMLVAGTRGSGKCLTGDSLVQLAGGSLKPIKELVDNVLLINSERTDDGFIGVPEKPIKVLTMNTGNLCFEEKEVKAVYKRKYLTDVIEVMTRSGRKVRVTPEHPFYTIKNGVLTEVFAEQIKKKDFITVPEILRTPLNLLEKYKRRMKLINAVTNEKSGFNYACINKNTLLKVHLSRPVKMPEFMDFISDSHVNKSKLMFTNSDDSLRNYYEKTGFSHEVKNVKVIPNISKPLKELYKGLFMKNLKGDFEGICNPSKKKLKEILNTFERRIIELNSLKSNELSRFKTIIENLRILAGSEVFFDEVVSVDRVINDEGYVYDLEVEGTHNFIANNIVVHNTSLLQSLLIEIMRRYRIIVIEDTLELPINYMRNIGYNIVSMKVRSAIVGSKSELSAADGIRTSLRLGDSSLIMGEIRSTEAKALYEAMRVGALANVVAGTIHGDSAYGVFDRVVNDLEVPRTSFKATDIIMIANKIRDPSGLREVRKLVDITEIRKDWEEDPVREHGFVTLMTYDSKSNKLVPTRDLLEGESEVLKSIAGRVREWAGNWDAVWENINLRTRTKELIKDYAEKSGVMELYEADFMVEANDAFHKIFDRLSSEMGYPETKDVLRLYEAWLKEKVKVFRKEMDLSGKEN